MARVRRCDSRCHNAKKPRCRCWCGGHYHGSQGAGNREALVQAVNEADQALLLQQHGFKEGETKYVQQLQLEKPALPEVKAEDFWPEVAREAEIVKLAIQTKPMMSRLLGKEEIKQIAVDTVGEGGTYTDYNVAEIIDAVRKAQDAKTLKAAGEWLESRLKQDISNFTQGFITLGDIEALKRGEMP